MKKEVEMYFPGQAGLQTVLTDAPRLIPAKRASRSLLALACVIGCLNAGCMKSLFNSWLEPAAVGDFVHEGTLEIRTAMSIQDSPLGIPGASEPEPGDLAPGREEYRFGPGDSMIIRILDLITQGSETPAEALVDELGDIRLPIAGTVPASGLTAHELEEEIADYLDQKDILRHAEVVVSPTVRRQLTYQVFGATAGANIYPLPTPNFSLLEALNVAGGFADAVTEIYIFRDAYIQPVDDGMITIPMQDMDESAGLEDEEPVHLSSLASLQPLVGGSLLASVGQPEPGNAPTPTTAAQDEARQELIDLVVPSEHEQTTSAAIEPTPTETPADSDQAPQSRWIFLNDKWIEVGPQTASSASGTERQTTSSAPRDEMEIQLPEMARESIDWGQLAGESSRRIIRISAEALRNGDVRQNIVVRPKDTIRLMAGETGEYYLMGQIARPGAYSLVGRRLTFKDVVASAGGLGPLAWPERCTLYRRLGDREEMIQVNADRIFSGQDADFYVKKDDLIVFGTHPATIFFAVLRNAFRITYGFGFVYDRNFADVDNTRRSVAASVKAQQAAAQSNRFQGLFP